MKNKNKVRVIIWLSIAISFSLHAQTINTPPSIVWQKCLGGTNYDVINCVKLQSDGGFIVVGGSSSNDGDMTINQGQNDFYLMRLDETGSLVWQHSYGGLGADDAYSVVSTFDGGYAVAGPNSSNDGDVTGNHGFSDYWLIKTDDHGIMQWEKSYGGTKPDVANVIQLTPDGGFVIAGKSYSKNGDVSGNHGDADAWIIKLDQDGNLQWQKSFGGKGFDVANDIHQTNDGGFIVAGYTRSHDGNITSNYGQEDFWLFKLNASGNLEWQKTMGGSGGDLASAVLQTMDGGYVLCGLTHSRDSDVVDHIEAHDMWIVKTDSYGSIQWSQCVGGTNGDNGVDIKQDADGTIIACAYTNSSDSDVSENYGLYDIWLTALDIAGNLLWEKTLGGSGDEYPRNLQILSPGLYIIAGYTYSNDEDVSGNHGDADGWIVKLDLACNTIYYADADGDGYGNLYSTRVGCFQPSGYASDSSDCNDDPNQWGGAIHPDATEVCNGIDDNCNAQIDEGAVTSTIIPSGSVILCPESTLMLYANTGTGLTFQWKKNGSNISGATSALYNTTVAGAFSLTVSSAYCTATSAATTVSITSRPPSTITPSGTVSICPGISLTMNANTGSGLTYQWLKNSTNISGATNSTYVTAETGPYKVIVTNSYGCSRTSSITKINNYAGASVKITVTGSLNICSTGSVLLSAKIVSDYTYQWFKDNVSISGATGTSYTATQAGTYSYKATRLNGCTKMSGNKTVTGCKLENENNGLSVVSVYPNPANSDFNIELHLEEEINGTARIELINIMGDAVLAENACVYEGTLFHTFSIKDRLPGGLYFVKIIIGDRVFFQRIIYQPEL